MTISLGGRRWRLDELPPELAEWLLAVRRGPAPEPLLDSRHVPALRELVRVLSREGLLLEDRRDAVALWEPRLSPLAAALRPHVEVDHRVLPRSLSAGLPTSAELEATTKLVILAGADWDRALAWFVRRCRLDLVLVTATADGAQVGWFPAGGACSHCWDLAHNPLRHRLQGGLSGRAPAAWMEEWVAAQTLLAVRQWQGRLETPPGWTWLEPSARSGRREVSVHPACCGRARPAA